MRLVVADTGPLHYLVLIAQVDLLPALFDKVTTPQAVRAELLHSEAPPIVRKWATNPPAWLDIAPTPQIDFGDPLVTALDDGEKAAIALASTLKAGLILMDDREGVAVARKKGFVVTGTLGILDLAARRRMIDLEKTFEQLKKTNFRYPTDIMDALLMKTKG